MELPQLDIVQRITHALYDKKGVNVYAVDVTDVSTMTDVFIVVQGGSDRQVCAMADAIEQVMPREELLHVEGRDEGKWVVLDYGAIVVHIMVPQLREHYALEELWSEGAIIELPYRVR